ncbi:MAG: hypothetical protein EZS28_009420 [Streblomastix strix]|uniref:Uncharacterized protein n=1 Tax=Streblomastix strix TaxID=222440 RepID=A0A5J4WKI8_9EUKA|nr:MAG: hypothetical protein EZS28_009420 [Streblomastix strix]
MITPVNVHRFVANEIGYIALGGAEGVMFISFVQTSDQVKQVLATRSFDSSYVALNRLTYFNLPVIVYQTEPSNLTYLISVSDLEYIHVFVQKFDKSVGALTISDIGLVPPAPKSLTLPPNSDIGLEPPAQSKITVLSAPDLINDDPVTVDIPSMELTNLQPLLNVLFVVIVFEVPNVTQLTISVVSSFSSNKSSGFGFEQTSSLAKVSLLLQQLLKSTSSVSILNII